MHVLRQLDWLVTHYICRSRGHAKKHLCGIKDQVSEATDVLVVFVTNIAAFNINLMSSFKFICSSFVNLHFLCSS